MDKRKFLKVSGIIAGGSILLPMGACNSPETTKDPKLPVAGKKADFTLPKLSYSFDALAPHIDAKTMTIHYGKHHAGYVKKLNNAIANTPFVGKSLNQIMASVTEKDTGIRNNGGGHFNHSLFWAILGPEGSSKFGGDIAAAINRDFGSLNQFKDQLTNAGKSVFGSGWAWLCVNDKKKLFITSTPNQDNPMMTKIVKQTGTPILGVDVWEHAYYLNYQNRRGDYLDNFFNVINWKAVENNLKKIS